MWHKINYFLSEVKLVWIQIFFIPLTSCLAIAKEHSLSYYLPIAKGKTDGFMPFPSALVQSGKQTALSKIWTCVADSISYNDNCYTKCASMFKKYNTQTKSVFPDVNNLWGESTELDAVKSNFFCLFLFCVNCFLRRFLHYSSEKIISSIWH